jgi:hypothetical protein
VLNWVTKTEGSWAYIGRSTVVAVLTIAALWAADAVESLLTGAPPDESHNIQEFLTTQIPYSNPITAGVVGAWEFFGGTVGLVLLTSWALVVLPVILVFLLMIVFRAVEFVIVRVAESPKGPVLGLSLLLGALGGVVKLFM